jgi:hypothetical protein
MLCVVNAFHPRLPFVISKTGTAVHCDNIEQSFAGLPRVSRNARSQAVEARTQRGPDCRLYLL